MRRLVDLERTASVQIPPTAKTVIVILSALDKGAKKPVGAGDGTERTAIVFVATRGP